MSETKIQGGYRTKLKAILESRGLKGRVLQDAWPGLSDSDTYNVLNGKKCLGPGKRITAIAEWLGLPESDLFDAEGRPLPAEEGK